jgi:hypothetical protein
MVSAMLSFTFRLLIIPANRYIPILRGASRLPARQNNTKGQEVKGCVECLAEVIISARILNLF